MDNSQLKVDLKKAQEACEKLSDDLSAAEAAKEAAEKNFKELKEELEVARKAKVTTDQYQTAHHFFILLVRNCQ